MFTTAAVLNRFFGSGGGANAVILFCWNCRDCQLYRGIKYLRCKHIHTLPNITQLSASLSPLSSRAIFFRLPVFALNHLLMASYHSGHHPNAHNSGVETFAVSKADIVRIIYDRQLRVLDKTNKA